MSWLVVGEVTVDKERRISLANVGKKEHTKYRIAEGTDGAIILHPIK